MFAIVTLHFSCCFEIPGSRREATGHDISGSALETRDQIRAGHCIKGGVAKGRQKRLRDGPARRAVAVTTQFCPGSGTTARAARPRSLSSSFPSPLLLLLL